MWTLHTVHMESKAFHICILIGPRWCLSATPTSPRTNQNTQICRAYVTALLSNDSVSNEITRSIKQVLYLSLSMRIKTGNQCSEFAPRTTFSQSCTFPLTWVRALFEFVASYATVGFITIRVEADVSLSARHCFFTITQLSQSLFSSIVFLYPWQRRSAILWKIPSLWAQAFSICRIQSFS